ncbi:hypothetical protein MRX96_001661 [Rhipicephalus microplus]
MEPQTSEKRELKWWTRCAKRHLGVAAPTPPASREPYRQLRSFLHEKWSRRPFLRHHLQQQALQVLRRLRTWNLAAFPTSQRQGHNPTTRHPGTIERTTTEDYWRTVLTLRQKKQRARERKQGQKRPEEHTQETILRIRRRRGVKLPPLPKDDFKIVIRFHQGLPLRSITTPEMAAAVTAVVDEPTRHPNTPREKRSARRFQVSSSTQIKIEVKGPGNEQQTSRGEKQRIPFEPALDLWGSSSSKLFLLLCQ